MNEVRAKLIAAGVKNMHQYGYPQASADNILTDEIYRAFFLSMLESTLGHAAEDVNNEVKALIRIVKENA